MDLEAFDIDSTTLDAWRTFTATLAEVLSVMDESSDLTISAVQAHDADEAPGIRFSAKDGTVTARILGDVDDEAALKKLGWEAPGGEEDTFHASQDQENTERLALLTTDTMQQFFDVLHPVFLEPDQLKEILSGGAPWQAPPPPKPEDVAITPPSRGELDRIVDQHLYKRFGHPALRNTDGDVAIRVGSTMLFLRSTPDAAEIVLFSPLVHDVSGRSRACEVLNDINVESRYGRFALHRDRVYVQVAVSAKPFVPAHLDQAIRVMSQIADGIDDELADKLGGRTTFPNY